MLRSRLIAGTILALGAGAILGVDAILAPYFPFLLIGVLVIGALAAHELRLMVPHEIRPYWSHAILGVLVVLVSNWVAPLAHPSDPWLPTILIFAASVLLTFLVAMNRFDEPGISIPRIAHTIFLITYLGLLPSFFLKLRWLGEPTISTSTTILLLTIFVPKVCDIGAYTFGRIFGKHPLTPRLSPKKTWEGLIGGLAAAIATAIGVGLATGIFPLGIPEAILFGLVVGLAGVLGDLAESLIKRDAQVKDASQTIPGFGGVLDVIDSVLFAAPVVYAWFVFRIPAMPMKELPSGLLP